MPSSDGSPDARRSRISEPIRKPWVWVGLVALMLTGIPWYLPQGTIGPIVLGLPLWTIVAILSTVLVAAYLHWMLSRHWNVVEDYEEAEGQAVSPDTPSDEIEGRW